MAKLVHKLPAHCNNHPVAALLVKVDTQTIVDSNKTARLLLNDSSRKMEFTKLSAFLPTRKIRWATNANAKDHGEIDLQTASGSIVVRAVSYCYRAGTKFVVVEFHRIAKNERHLFERFLFTSKESTFIIAPDFKILAYNVPAALNIQKMFGKQVCEGDSMLRYAEPSTLDAFKSDFNKALLGEEVAHEIRVPFPDFDRWWLASYIPVADSHGNVVGVAFSAFDIHEKKSTEELLLKTKQQLVALTDNLPRSVVYQFLLSADGKEMSFPYVSSGAWELFGLSAQEMMRDATLGFKMIHPDEISGMRARMEESRKTEGFFEFTHRLVVNEQLKWVATRSRPRKFADGSVLWDGITIDVTKQIEAEIEVVDLKNQYQLLVESINGIVWQGLVDTLSFSFVSRQAEKILGYPIEQWISDPLFWVNHIVEEDREQVIAFCSSEIAGNRNHQLEYRMVAADGRHVWLQDQVWVNGSKVGGVMIDITARKLADEKTRKSESHLKALLNASHDIVYLLDADFNIVLFNQRAKESVEQLLHRELMAGVSILDYGFVGNEDIFRDRLRQCLGGQRIDAEFEMKIEGQLPFWISIQYNPVKDEGNTIVGVSISLSDITHQKNAQALVRKKDLQLRRLADNLPKGVIYQRVTNAEGSQLSAFFSAGFTELTGVPIEEAIPNRDYLRTLTSTSDFDFLMQQKEAITATQAPRELAYEYPIIHRATGQKRWLYSMSRSSRTEEGGISWDGILLDITDRKDSEILLRSKETQLSMLANSLPKGAIYQRIVNIDGTQISAYFSKGYAYLVGIAQEEILRSPAYLETILDSSTYQEYKRRQWVALENFSLFDFEFPITHGVTKEVRWLKIVSRYSKENEYTFSWNGIVVDVSDRKFAEEKLKVSESNLQSVFENTDTGFVQYDKAFKVVSFNRLADSLARKYLNKPIVKNAFGPDYFNEARKEQFNIYFNRALNGQSSVYEINYGTAEIPFHLFGRLFPAQDDQLNVYGVIFALTDITLIKEAQYKLARSQKLYESLVKSQTSFLIRTDVQGVYTFVNQRFLDHFGFTEPEVIGKHSFETVHTDDWALCEKAVLECMTHPGKVVRVDFRKPTKDKRFFWTSWEFVTIQNEEGAITEIQCLGYDITDKLNTENRLAQVANRLLVATQSAALGIWDYDPATNEVNWDDRMREIFGISSATTITLANFKKWVHPDDWRNVKTVIQNSAVNSIDFVYRIIRQSDAAIRYVQAFGIHQTASSALVGVNLDITERIEKEIVMAQAKTQIEQLQLSALRAAMNPHFIFNALNSIQYFITQNNRQSAIGYLSKFSKLVRGILDSSTARKATIATELELIKYYVEIEQLRFENKFDFQVSVDANIDIEMIELPALLIQPFIENAILHGLYTKAGQGVLKLNVTEDSNFINIVVVDNGIGRRAAAALRKANFPEHKSKGMHLTTARIELLSERQPIHVMIDDLEENGLPSGTRIKIRLAKEQGE